VCGCAEAVETQAPPRPREPQGPIPNQSGTQERCGLDVGIKKEDVKVEFNDGVLTVEGERKQEKEEKGKKFHKIEREYGKFVRRFALPTEIDASKLTAEFKEGVLNVHLPKSADTKPKAISVKVA